MAQRTCEGKEEEEEEEEEACSDIVHCYSKSVQTGQIRALCPQSKCYTKSDYVLYCTYLTLFWVRLANDVFVIGNSRWPVGAGKFNCELAFPGTPRTMK
jgi:hypothetical protein